jgi:hypothetical protein
MARGFGNFASGFVKTYFQGRQFMQEQEDRKKERDARVKLFELQMKREQQAQQQVEQQQTARGQLFEKLSGASPLQAQKIDPSGQPLPQQGQVLDPRGPTSLTDLLADPEGAMLLLRSGAIGGEDILKRQMALDNQKMMRDVMGGGGAPMGMELQGVKLGPEGQIMPDFGLPQVSVQTLDTPEGKRVFGVNPRTGARVSDIGAAPEEKRTPEEAGRISGLLQAREIGQGVTAKFVDPETGKVNRQLVMTSFGRVPGTEGREIRNDMSIAVDAVLRARTGAGVNATEMKEVVEQFLPSPLDTDDGVASKMMRFNQFVNGALDVATLPPRIRKMITDKGLIDESGATGGAGGNVVDFNSLPK